MNQTFLNFHFSKGYPSFKLVVEASFCSGIVAVFGPSGSGKSTLLSCIAGLTKPDEGEILLNGRHLFSSCERINLPPESRRIGYVFQEGLLFPHLNVRQNLMYGFNRTPVHRRRVNLQKLIDIVELGPLLERHPSKLSGGERQRVALARALATSPDLLLLDEPLGSLDIRLRGRILQYLKTLHSDLSIPMVYVSHSISEILAIADTAMVIVGGRQIAHATPLRLLFEPYVQPIVEMESLENLLEVEVIKHWPGSGLSEVSLDGTTLWIPQVMATPSDRIYVSIRAGDIIVAVQKPGPISARNVIKARITGLHKMDKLVLVEADVGKLILAEITPDAVHTLGLKQDQEVFLVIKSSSVMVLH